MQTVPYTYILKWINLDKSYIGARWGKGCHPNDLWSTYFTSSKYVKEFVKLHGNPDVILIDKIFDNQNEAIEQEKKLLKAANAAKDEKFLNKAIGGIFDFNDSEIREKIRKGNLGKKHSEKTKEWYKVFHSTRKRSAETGKKISEALTGKKLSPEHIEKSKKGKIGIVFAKRGSPKTPEHIERMRKMNRLGIKHSLETKVKMANARRGVPFYKVECPHCGKVGGVTGMKCWHFDKCKKLIKGLDDEHKFYKIY